MLSASSADPRLSLRTDSLLKRSVENAARARFALPVVMVLAVLAMVVNELAYRHVRDTLTRGIALTDARIEGARALQALTELEVVARAWVATQDSADVGRFQRAEARLARASDKTFGLIEKVGERSTISVERLRGLIGQQLEVLRASMQMPAAGTADRPSIDQAEGRQRSIDLAAELEGVLAQGAAFQQQQRLSFYDSLHGSRAAVHLAIVVAVLALVLFAYQLRRADTQQALEHERLGRLVDQRTAELRDLAGHLVNARESERSHLSRELHDQMGGLFTVMKLELARLRRLVDLPGVAAERAEGVERRLNECIALKRMIIENLRPSALDQLGLSAALEHLCRDTAAVSGLRVHASIDDLSLDADVELTVFRLTQESLTNVLKYADAKEVWVTLQASAGQAHLSVRDDGQGFDPQAVGVGHHGIFGMRLRVEAHGGHWQLDSTPGNGTRVAAQLPCASASLVASAAG